MRCFGLHQRGWYVNIVSSSLVNIFLHDIICIRTIVRSGVKLIHNRSDSVRISKYQVVVICVHSVMTNIKIGKGSQVACLTIGWPAPAL
jgi:hypothetical protein